MNNKQLAHIWAQQNRSSGKGSSFYFEGATIFSYGPHFPIARFTRDANGKSCVLFTYKSYSNSTAKHINYTRGALHGLGLRVFHVAKPTDNPALSDADYLKECAEENMMKVDSARTRKDFYLGEAQRFEKEFFDFCRAFKIKHPAARKKTLFARGWIARVKADAEAALKKREKEIAERARRDAEKTEKDRARWRAGEFSGYVDGPTMVRIAGDQVETSRGAVVPLERARELFRLWRGWRNDPARLSGFLVGQEIGEFTVQDVQVDYVRIGCHTLDFAEVAAVLS